MVNFSCGQLFVSSPTPNIVAPSSAAPSLSSDNSPQPPSSLLHITITTPSPSPSPLHHCVSLFFLTHLFVSLLALQPLLLPLILTTPSHLPGRGTTQVHSMQRSLLICGFQGFNEESHWTQGAVVCANATWGKDIL